MPRMLPLTTGVFTIAGGVLCRPRALCRGSVLFVNKAQLKEWKLLRIVELHVRILAARCARASRPAAIVPAALLQHLCGLNHLHFVITGSDQCARVFNTVPPHRLWGRGLPRPHSIPHTLVDPTGPRQAPALQNRCD
jgi:hypothetical protein